MARYYDAQHMNMRKRPAFRQSRDERFALMRAAKEARRERAIADGWTPEPRFRRHGSPMHMDRTVADLAVLMSGSC